LFVGRLHGYSFRRSIRQFTRIFKPHFRAELLEVARAAG
jgi:hypothetical protein